MQLVADDAAFPVDLAPPGPASFDLTSGTTELDDLEADDILLPDEQAALQLETSLVGGLQKMRARRKTAKTKARTRVTMARNAHKRKLMGPQRGRASAVPAGPSASSAAPAVPPPPPAPEEPYIRAHRRREKYPTMEVLPDGSYIRLSVNADGSLDMRAVCSKHTEGPGLLECNLSRTCRPGRRGRPLGLLTWFLQSAHKSNN